MTVWAIADPHLSFNTPDKKMDLFGPRWHDHAKKIEDNWRSLVQPEDLVLVAGDISWAGKWNEAITDLQWLDSLPGTKVLSKGNHDHWWPSLEKLHKNAPPSLHFVHNSVLNWGDLSIAGARLWDCPDFSFGQYVEYTENPKEKTIAKKPPPSKEETLRIYTRDLERLEIALRQLSPSARVRIAMVHYPPVNAALDPSPASSLLEKYGVTHCIFGHLHNIRPGSLHFGTARGVSYHLTACDFLDFTPIKLPI